MPKRFIAAAVSALAVAAILPGSALAVDTFVEPDTGNDANNCTQAVPGGVGVGPCLTVQAAVNKAAPSGTVRVDLGDTFPEAIVLSGGVSLVGQDLEASDTGPAIIDGGGSTAVYVPPASAGGTIQGLTLRGDSFGVFAEGSLAQVTQNVFDDPTGAGAGVGLSGPSTTVSSNTFVGDGVGTETAISLTNGSATVASNTISGHNTGIVIGGTGGPGGTATPTITSNRITGIHEAAFTGTGIAAFSSTNATLVGNRLSEPGTGAVIGIAVNGFSSPSETGVTMRRNQVRGGFVNGIDIRDTGLESSLNSDLVTGATSSGFNFADQGAPSAVDGDVSAVNITAWGNGTDIETFQNVLTLDSGITQDPISAGAATCVISFSRGPTTTGPCGGFQTTADPMFIDPAGGDFHLQPGSPMIDAGNPAVPGAGILDFDGEPRALDPAPACSPAAGRRDVGADEFLAPTPASCFPPTVIPPQTANQPQGVKGKKKCKKGRKLKKNKCVKTKKRKKKK